MIMKVLGMVIGVLIVVLALAWVFQGNDFFMYKYFGLKYEQQRRQIFEQSRAFNQGMVQELQNMQFEYAKANLEQKDALASIILHRASGYNLNDPIVPSDLRGFVEGLRRERSSGQ